MRTRKNRAVRAVLTAELMFVLIGAVGSGLLSTSTPAQAEQRCSRCGNVR